MGRGGGGGGGGGMAGAGGRGMEGWRTCGSVSDMTYDRQDHGMLRRRYRGLIEH